MSSPFLEGSYCHDVEQRVAGMEARMAYQGAYIEDVPTNADENEGGFGLLSLGSLNVLNSRCNDHAQRINEQGQAINSIKNVLVGSGLIEDGLS